MNGEIIFEDICAYCIEKGFLDQLNKSLKRSEFDRFRIREIDKSGLDVLDVIHCLVDKHRTSFLLNEIERLVKKGDKVLEAGIGTGILSFAAGELGASVCGIELNPQVLGLANDISRYLQEKDRAGLGNVKFHHEDATKYIPPFKLDVIISENIYTGLFFENQVQIMNNLIKYLKPDGKVIPLGLQAGLGLVDLEIPFTPSDYELFVVNEFSSECPYKELSNSAIYTTFNFEHQNEELIDSQISLDIAENGTANGVLIWSEVLMYGDRIIDRSDTEFMNNDIILYLPEEIELEKGDKIDLSVQYYCGCNPDSVKISFN